MQGYACHIRMTVLRSDIILSCSSCMETMKILWRKVSQIFPISLSALVGETFIHEPFCPVLMIT